MPLLLLIDEPPVFLDLERSFVRRPEFELVAAENGAELLRKAAENRPDLVISPATLSDMKGSELCQRLRGDPATKGVPVVLYGSAAEKHAGRASPPEGFLVAPWAQPQLLGAVRRFCPISERGSDRAAVSVKVVCGDGSESYVAFTKDISTTGLFLKGASMAQPGATLRLRLSLPGGSEPVAYDLEAEVVRRVPRERDSHLVHGIGVRFLGLPLDQKLPLARFVREHPGL